MPTKYSGCHIERRLPCPLKNKKGPPCWECW